METFFEILPYIFCGAVLLVVLIKTVGRAIYMSISRKKQEKENNDH